MMIRKARRIHIHTYAQPGINIIRMLFTWHRLCFPTTGIARLTRPYQLTSRRTTHYMQPSSYTSPWYPFCHPPIISKLPLVAKVILVAMPVALAALPTVQSIGAAILMSVCAGIHLAVWPYLTEVENKLELFGLVIHLLLVLGAILFT